MEHVDLVARIIDKLNSGNVTEAVEMIMYRRRSKPAELATVIIELTHELIAKQNYRSLQVLKQKLKWYQENNVKWG